MLWEWVATLFAGLGAAGVVLSLRFFIKRLPKWSVPAAAGLGMMLFQVYSEYTWYGHAKSLLPPTAVVVAEIAETAPYKPWSYYKPQILKFVAIDRSQTAVSNDDAHLRQARLYFFERRMSAHSWPIMLDCRQGLQATVLEDGKLASGWSKEAFTDRIIGVVCAA